MYTYTYIYIHIRRWNTNMYTYTYRCTGMEPSELSRPMIPGIAPLFFALSSSRSWWSRELAPDTDI